MDFAEPKRLPKNYYATYYLKDSREAFLSAIKEKCVDKEDQTACVEKYSAAFNSVFDHLKTKLEEEDRAVYIFDKRQRDVDGIWPELAQKNYNTGYEKI
jgi:hypothetical protein